MKISPEWKAHLDRIRPMLHEKQREKINGKSHFDRMADAKRLKRQKKSI
jgi:hypothetical protein